jgi:exosome complex component RRP42
MKMSDEAVAEITLNYLQKLAAQGKRVDERRFDQYRDIRITRNVAGAAEGSAEVCLGETTVLVGVKMEIGEPFADTPDKGVLTTNVELIPMASPTFESGPPSPQAIELARVVDRGIRESKCIGLDKLCITPKEKVWILFIDIHVLDYDGNLFDCAALAAIAALRSTIVPAAKFELGQDYPLPLAHLPVSCTAVKIGSSMLFDPSLDEDRAAEARITISTDENGHIRAMQKGLSGALSYGEITQAIESAKKLGADIRGRFLG